MIITWPLGPTRRGWASFSLGAVGAEELASLILACEWVIPSARSMDSPTDSNFVSEHYDCFKKRQIPADLQFPLARAQVPEDC